MRQGLPQPVHLPHPSDSSCLYPGLPRTGRTSRRKISRRRWGYGMVVVAALIAAGSSARADQQITVNSPSDVVDASPGDRICETAAGNGVCTLRAAIMEANHTLSGTVSIQVPASPVEYTLTIEAFGVDDERTGDLNITRTVSIIGEGAASTIINGNGTITHDRAVSIARGISVVLAGITVHNGRAGQVYGGGIYSVGTLTVTDSMISGNTAGESGGLIANDGGTLTVTNSTISGNTAGFGGAGIYGAGPITVTNSTISGNDAGNGGGGILNVSTLTVVNSTISGNSTAGSSLGGGILGAGPLTVTNSTISGNNATGSGGGIFSESSAALFNATIANNQADADFDGRGLGGGVYNDGGTITFQNSHIAGNAETIPCDGIVCPAGTYIPVTGECGGSPITSNGNNMLVNFDTSHCVINGAGEDETGGRPHRN